MGVRGFEPRTSALSELRSNQLSYTPFVPEDSHTGQGGIIGVSFHSTRESHTKISKLSRNLSF